MFTDHSFLHASKIDSVRDEVSIQQVVIIWAASSVDDSEPMVIELSEDVRAKATSEASAMGTKDDI